jgi:hypothetical protein
MQSLEKSLLETAQIELVVEVETLDFTMYKPEKKTLPLQKHVLDKVEGFSQNK